ncbi:MAG: hypothetical protein ABI566_12430 [Pseudolysinimonas sp.]
MIAYGPRLDHLPQVGIQVYRDDLPGAVSGWPSSSLRPKRVAYQEPGA